MGLIFEISLKLGATTPRSPALCAYDIGSFIAKEQALHKLILAVVTTALF